MAERIALLNLMKEHKDLIFSKTNKAPIQKKVQAWIEIEKKAKELGIIEPHKDWRHIRTVTWQNWRKRAIDKAILAKKFYGTPKAKKFIFDQSEKIIFEILGEDSPVSVDKYSTSASIHSEDESQTALSELSAETERDTTQLVEAPSEADKTGSGALKRKRIETKDFIAAKRNLLQKEKELLNKQLEMARKRLCSLQTEREKRPSTISFPNEKTSDIAVQCLLEAEKEPEHRECANPSKVKSKNSDTEITSLRKNQMILEQKLITRQLDMLEREQYKTDLEIYKIEREYSLPPSKFTRKFYESLLEEVDSPIEDDGQNSHFDFLNEASNHIIANGEFELKQEPEAEWEASASDLD